MTNHMEAGLSLETDPVLRLMRENERLRRIAEYSLEYFEALARCAKDNADTIKLIIAREQELEKQDEQ